MQNNNSGPKELILPLSTVLRAQDGPLAGKALVTFRPGKLPSVHSGGFVFEGTVMMKKETPSTKDAVQEDSLVPFPVFTVIAVLLVVMFRNLFHQSFIRYFISVKNNYEIDFSLQKIGLPAIGTALFVNLFVLIDFIRIFRIDATAYALLAGLQLLILPMLLSALIIFLFSFSIRAFPLVFSDIKIIFLLSFGLMSVNFLVFAQKGISMLWLEKMPVFFLVLFMLLRSFYFFEVLGKFYRYRTTMSLFYICTLNLTTSLLIHKIWF